MEVRKQICQGLQVTVTLHYKLFRDDKLSKRVKNPEKQDPAGD